MLLLQFLPRHWPILREEQPGIGRDLRRTIDWAVRDCIRLFLLGGLAIKVARTRWRSGISPNCKLLGCTTGWQSDSHVVLRCVSCVVAGARTDAHGRLVSGLKISVPRIRFHTDGVGFWRCWCRPYEITDGRGTLCKLETRWGVGG